MSAIPDIKASALERGRVGIADALRNHLVWTHGPRPGVRPRPAASGSTAIAAAALRSFVLIVIATLLVLVALPAALVAAGT